MAKIELRMYALIWALLSTLSFAQSPWATNATSNSTASPMYNSSNSVAVYWGQNSYGQSSGPLVQQRLSTYCANTNIDIIPMAFMIQITTGQGNLPVLNFANQQNDCPVFPGTELVNCSEIAEDIMTCQQTYNKKILLSIGGATYTEGGFSSPAAAHSAARMVWRMFGPQQSSSPPASFSRIDRRKTAALRPFGDAVIDGFDFDFESTVTNTIPFAKTLRHLMSRDTSKQYLLTAAPQCPFPDAADGTMLNEVPFDAVFVQYYNNPCGLQTYVAGATSQSNFNFGTWDNWSRTGSANKNIRIFLGVPANTGAAGTGYEGMSQLQPIIEYAQTFESFGGVMMWDMSQAYANTGFLDGVKGAMSSGASKVRKAKRRRWQDNMTKLLG